MNVSNQKFLQKYPQAFNNQLNHTLQKYVPLVYRADIIPPKYQQQIEEYESNENQINQENEDFEKNNKSPISAASLQTFSSHQSDYLDDDVYEFLLEIQKNKEKSKPVLDSEHLGADMQDLEDYYYNEINPSNNQKNKQPNQFKSQQSNFPNISDQNNSLNRSNKNFDTDFFQDSDFQHFSQQNSQKKEKKEKKNRPPKPNPKKLDEENLSQYSLQLVYEFLELKFIDQYENDKLEKLKPIFIIYKHPHLPLQTIKIFEFFVPVYLQIDFKDDIQQEFLDWKDFLIKRMNLHSQEKRYLHTLSGKDIENFQQIPLEQNILLLSSQSESNFWNDFTNTHKIQLSSFQLVQYTQYLNSLSNVNEIHFNITSIGQIQKTLKMVEKKRLIKKEKYLEYILIKNASITTPYIEISSQNTNINSPLANFQNNTQEDSQTNSKFKFKQIFPDQTGQITPVRYLTKEQIEEHEQKIQQNINKIKSQCSDNIKKIKENIDNQQNIFRNYQKPHTTSHKSLNQKNKQQLYDYNNIKNKFSFLEQIKTQPLKYRKKFLEPIRNSQFEFQQIPEKDKIQPAIQRSQSDPKALKLMYNKYQKIITKQTVEDKFLQAGTQKKLIIGPVLQNFNKVRMRILQQKIPNISKDIQNQSIPNFDKDFQKKFNFEINQNKNYNKNNNKNQPQILRKQSSFETYDKKIGLSYYNKPIYDFDFNQRKAKNSIIQKQPPQTMLNDFLDVEQNNSFMRYKDSAINNLNQKYIH
ncbi:hypothetical protein PPERSA_07209 [Pseudocohnilembus persalinus]|uniref:Uncharacterized protein n=1 Tax=Pseudocohnilembus persalinus TaxID=266149 RepID=A0A0V0QD47_PSEPJ|nr:hypothetical protein PPERSA_07209 [Pseudocohnilembus persalinus]|eukprot:KRX00102.1 hypothetical protein PPERSA_07209 [Pseudocohnilembus persalinus]